MPVFHVNSSYISKGKSASGFAAYLHREQLDQATQLRRYLDREGRGHEDLLASGHAHLGAPGVIAGKFTVYPPAAR